MCFLPLGLLLHDNHLTALTLFVGQLRFDYVIGTPLGLLDFLPRLHLFLLQERNSIGEQLRIFLNTTISNKRELAFCFQKADHQRNQNAVEHKASLDLRALLQQNRPIRQQSNLKKTVFCTYSLRSLAAWNTLFAGPMELNEF